MSTLHNKLQASPLLARALPFVVFLVLTSAQGSFGPDSQFWVYLLKTLVGVWMIWTIWPLVGEMRWALSIEAVGGGLLVFLLWIGLDFPYPKLLESDDSVSSGAAPLESELTGSSSLFEQADKVATKISRAAPTASKSVNGARDELSFLLLNIFIGFLSQEAIHPDRSPFPLFLTPERRFSRKKVNFPRSFVILGENQRILQC